MSAKLTFLQPASFQKESPGAQGQGQGWAVMGQGASRPPRAGEVFEDFQFWVRRTLSHISLQANTFFFALSPPLGLLQVLFVQELGTMETSRSCNGRGTSQCSPPAPQQGSVGLAPCTALDLSQPGRGDSHGWARGGEEAEP